MGDKNMPDASRVDAQPVHFFRQPVVIVAGVDHEHRIPFPVKENVGDPFPHTGDVFIDPARIQRLEVLLPAVHFAHFFF